VAINCTYLPLFPIKGPPNFIHFGVFGLKIKQSGNPALQAVAIVVISENISIRKQLHTGVNNNY
jgi:hypothetical protein